MVVHKGSCHCKRVVFEVKAPKVLEVLECNCSICSKTGYLHLIVPKKSFEIIKGEQFLTTYKFNTGTAEHTFCKICGVKPFYIPRSNPDGYSINVRCLDKANIEKIVIKQFDGENWEDNASNLENSSK